MKGWFRCSLFWTMFPLCVAFCDRVSPTPFPIWLFFVSPHSDSSRSGFTCRWTLHHLLLYLAAPAALTYPLNKGLCPEAVKRPPNHSPPCTSIWIYILSAAAHIMLFFFLLKMTFASFHFDEVSSHFKHFSAVLQDGKLQSYQNKQTNKKQPVMTAGLLDIHCVVEEY